jgi:hypothetical protein
MPPSENLRIEARTTELTGGVHGQNDETDHWTFSGVAVGEGDILTTDDGTRVLFSATVLEAAADTQKDEPLTIDHPADDDGAPLYPPPVAETPGRVVKAGYIPGKGLVYEATTHDADVAAGIHAGSFDVSVHPTFDLGEIDAETGAYIPENVSFHDLSVVSKGMSPSNTAEWGANRALASWSKSADISAELSAQAQEPSLDAYGTGMQGYDEHEELRANTDNPAISKSGRMRT